MGFEAVYFAREDYQEQDQRQADGTLEHVWVGDDHGTGDLFTGLLAKYYCTPGGMNWDLKTGSDDPVVTNAESDEYNVEQVVKMVEEKANVFAKSVVHNHVLFPMGCDFTYQNAHAAFKNMDKLIEVVNARSKVVNLVYSTPSCYTKAVHESRKVFTSKTDDYFPYGEQDHCYWTGYFSSRPALKRYERFGNNHLQVCKQLTSLVPQARQPDHEPAVTKLREAVAILQHHDGVSGTEKQHVANDYARQISKGVEACHGVIDNIYQHLQAGKEQHVFCNYLNISKCEVTEELTHPVVLTIYNPLAWAVNNHTIQLPVTFSGDPSAATFSVSNGKGTAITSSLVAIMSPRRELSVRSTSKATHVLTFQVDLPALGYARLRVTRLTTKIDKQATLVTSSSIKDQATKLAGAGFNLVVNSSGHLVSVVLDSGETIRFEQQFGYYKAEYRGWPTSGAYTFVPTSNIPVVADIIGAHLVHLADGSWELHQVFDKSKFNFLTQIVRVRPWSPLIEFDWVVGPLPIEDDDVGKEMITRFLTDLNTKGTFHTDANGRQMLKRVFNQRASYKLHVNERIAGNYYPLNSRMIISDEGKALLMTVFNDRAQGGTSPADGAAEMMIHRRLVHDDGFGADEALSEPGEDGKGLIVQGKHYVHFGKPSEAVVVQRRFAQQVHQEPIISFAVEKSPKPSTTTMDSWSGLTKPLPDNVHLLTLEPWNAADRYLLRLENIFEAAEHRQLGKAVVVNLRNMFKLFTIKSAEEVTLSANQAVGALDSKLVFNYTMPSDYKVTKLAKAPFDSHTLDVTLNPAQIRTFLVEVTRNAQ